MTLKDLHSDRAAPWAALFLSGGLLIGAWIFQYGFGYQPCTMCYWQRHAHKAVLGLAALWLISRALKVGPAEILKWAVVAALLVSVWLAAWHVAVEFGWLEGPKTCSGGDATFLDVDPNNPFGILDKKIKPPACSEAVWHFLGVSMAGWNAALSLAGAIWVATSRIRGKAA